MSSVTGGSGASYPALRAYPAPGEVGCPGSCPLCAAKGEGMRAPPCLACRDELRTRLSEMQLHRYVEKALN